MPTDTKALRALLDKATPGELRLSGVGDGTVGTLIVAAVNALPNLLREVEELRAAVAQEREACAALRTELKAVDALCAWIEEEQRIAEEASTSLGNHAAAREFRQAKRAVRHLGELIENRSTK